MMSSLTIVLDLSIQLFLVKFLGIGICSTRELTKTEKKEKFTIFITNNIRILDFIIFLEVNRSIKRLQYHP